jgi:hypothetical protein
MWVLAPLAESLHTQISRSVICFYDVLWILLLYWACFGVSLLCRSEFRQEYNAQHPDNKSVAAVSHLHSVPPRCFPLGILQMSYFFVFWWVRWARQQGKSGVLCQRKWVISPIPSTFCFRFRSNIVPM